MATRPFVVPPVSPPKSGVLVCLTCPQCHERFARDVVAESSSIINRHAPAIVETTCPFCGFEVTFQTSDFPVED